MLFRKALGYVIYEYRKTNNLTLRQFSILRGIKMSYSYLWELEQGKKEASSETLSELSRAMRITTADLVMKVSIEMSGGVPDFIPESVDEQLVNL
jgi:transcriptional regulator with XRE-family HTH domain